MFVKKRKDSTDPRVRSLLQKAVRRGHSETVQRAACHLQAAGDKTWLRSRAVVITFEECWPMAQHLAITTRFESRLTAFLRVASAIKQKDAAGLGALAYAFGEGDKTMLDIVPSRRALKIVYEAIKRPVDFFEWAKEQCTSPPSLKVIDAARQYLAAATWAWDKACIIAGAFLATTGDIPECGAASEPDSDFPYWVALDKHTPQGKEVLREIARERSISYRHLLWASFYFESAKVDAISKSPWWNAEKTWRLTRTGLTNDAASQLWNQLHSVIAERLSTQAEELRNLVEHCTVNQISLF